MYLWESSPRMILRGSCVICGWELALVVMPSASSGPLSPMRNVEDMWDVTWRDWLRLHECRDQTMTL
jgi:hypothetical protein